jgi:TRAP-type mannitol/chloroaromatic compound transport system substrate-binding protein
MRTYTAEAIDEITARDPKSRKVYESYRSFQQKAADYAAITEKAYYNRIQVDAGGRLG